MIHVPGGASFPEFTDLADRVTNGDGTGWAGDPRLELHVGVIADQHGNVRGHRLEVWRACEDGTDQIIGTWHPSEAYKVCFDLAQMRLDAPGRESVESRIDAHNAKLEDKAMEPWREFMAQKIERAAYDLMRKQGHARNRFSVPNNPLAR